MELVIEEVKKASKFIEANTQAIELSEIKEKHIIPVFTKDNKEIISHFDFVSFRSSTNKNEPSN